MPKKPKEETLLPSRKGREAPFKRIQALPEVERHQAFMRLREELRAHPDSVAKQRIEKCLVEAHLHADLKASPELSKLVFVFREIVHDFIPGETVEQALEPLQTVMARHGGGRPTEVDHDAVKRHHKRLQGDHDATSQTAAEFGITTRTVRNILKG